MGYEGGEQERVGLDQDGEQDRGLDEQDRDEDSDERLDQDGSGEDSSGETVARTIVQSHRCDWLNPSVEF